MWSEAAVLSRLVSDQQQGAVVIWHGLTGRRRVKTLIFCQLSNQQMHWYILAMLFKQRGAYSYLELAVEVFSSLITDSSAVSSAQFETATLASKPSILSSNAVVSLLVIKTHKTAGGNEIKYMLCTQVNEM